MEVVTGQEMQELDQKTIGEVGIAGVVLMEAAGKGAAKQIAAQLRETGPILILAGKGNNGGDGFVIHRYLAHWGYQCTTLLLTAREEVTGDARVNLDILDYLEERVISVNDEAQLTEFWEETANYSLFVDAILGTGLKGEVRGLSRRVIELVNEASQQVIAVDIPSGLDAQKGMPLGVAVKAMMTVTFACPKLGLLLDPGRAYVGRLRVVDIGIPDQLIKKARIRRYLLTDELCQKLLPQRPATGHKGTFGKVFLLAGSEGMTGAAALSSEAVLRSGAGIVTLGIPQGLNPIMEGLVREVMTYPLPDRAGHLAAKSVEELKEILTNYDLIAVGPGLGQGIDQEKIIEYLIKESNLPVVIDADGLNNMSSSLESLKDRQALTVLTPHPGEMARLLGIGVEEVQKDRVSIAQNFAQEYGVVVVLKGAVTLTALPSGELYLNSSGNSGMGTGGSGDVLTGMISGLLAQQLQPESIPAAVYIHGLAGDLWSQESSSRSLIAGDLLNYLGKAFQKIEKLGDVGNGEKTSAPGLGRN